MLKFIKPKKKKYLKLKALNKCPQKSGVCVKVYYTTPKKPNSALRKVVKVRLSNSKYIISHIPGEGHSLMKFSSVLIRGCRVRDLPGINYRVIRNATGFNLKCVLSRKKGRSKYGTKKVLDKYFKM